MYLFIYKYVNKKTSKEKRKKKSVTHSRFLKLKIQIKKWFIILTHFRHPKLSLSMLQ